MREFGLVVDDDVRFKRMMFEIVLVIILGGIKRLQRNDASDDRLRVDFSGVELGDVGFGDFLLLGSSVENRRAILRAVVGALAVEFRGIVAHGEKDQENLAVGDLRGIEDDFDGFGV